MPHSLRTFLDSIDNRMLHIHDPVDPLTQVGYLCSESQGPLMFHNMEGFPDWRLTDILIKDRAGQAAAFGLDNPNEVCPYLAEQMATKRGKSVMVEDGPVKEVKMLGKDVNLHALPIPQHSHGDGGPHETRAELEQAAVDAEPTAEWPLQGLAEGLPRVLEANGVLDAAELQACRHFAWVSPGDPPCKTPRLLC